MSLRSRLEEFATSVGTDYKELRVWLTGSSSGTLASLATTDKSSVFAAIAELKSSSGSPAPASESVAGVLELASLVEVNTGTDAARAVTPAGVRQERDALKAEILGGAGPAFDTLNELQALIAAAEESDVIDALTTVVGGKADKTEIYTRTELGDPETDLVAVYTAAKA